MAYVLQRGRNHNTFEYHAIAQEDRPDLVERFRIGALPTLVVVDGKVVRGRLETPNGTEEIEAFLAPWLRGSHIHRHQSRGSHIA